MVALLFRGRLVKLSAEALAHCSPHCSHYNTTAQYNKISYAAMSITKGEDVLKLFD